jgi:hypothetical protein
MTTYRSVILVLVFACGLAVPGEAQLELVRGNPIQEFVSPVVLESPIDLWSDGRWTSNEFRAFKCEGVVIDRLVVTREFNKKRTEATINFEVVVANNASVGRRNATIRVEFVSDKGRLKLRKGSKFTETQAFSFQMDSGGKRSDNQKMQASAADLQNIFSGANPRIVISIMVSQT